MILTQQGRLQEAESCLLRALALEPTDAAAHYNLGLARRLLRAEPGWGACAGTHRLYALCALFHLHREHPCLSPDCYEQVKDRLRWASRRLTEAQGRSGGWGPSWADAPDRGHGWGRGAPEDVLHVTAHQIEWCMACPPELRPPDPVLGRALRFLVDVLGEENPNTAAAYANLALNQMHQGKYAEAEKDYRKALEILRKTLGNEHPHTANSYNNLASN